MDKYLPPPHRRLRIFALDPSLSTTLETAAINHAVIKVPWEENLQPGPIGEYVEVVDVDPASGCLYSPVDLNHQNVLAQDGLPPSEGNPHFHQQMVYAVAMATIENFEHALGRVPLWAPRRYVEKGRRRREFVQRLRIYPHALREANAYYSPAKKALLFGYFPASTDDARQHLPRGMVFTCLSHDIIAHETTHALLDGLHPRFMEPTNADVLAFHEAFADIVAIFQHFSFEEVLQHQIAQTRGDLATENLLAKLAVQFGRATSRQNALRDALGESESKDGETRWNANKPDPKAIEKAFEPHARGAILVAAVFDAFLKIYKSRVADLFRLASGGSGILPEGALHPDLVARLSKEAAKSAQHVLTMCIRALDYCPPVDMTFGDYLRALVTADYDLVRDDDLNYRTALIDAFRQRGIYPRDVRVLSVESLLWQHPTEEQQRELKEVLPCPQDIRRLVSEWEYGDAEDFEDLESEEAIAKRWQGRLELWGKAAPAKCAAEVKEEKPRSRAEQAYFSMRKQARTLHYWFTERKITERKSLGLQANSRFEVHSVRPLRRVGPDGQRLDDLIVTITQRHRPNEKKGNAARKEVGEGEAAMLFRGGFTLLINSRTGEVRYAIMKRTNSEGRRKRQEEFIEEAEERSALVRTLKCDGNESDEPFALVHRSAEEEWE